MTPSSRLRVVIGAGGTGGHIYPGLAVADALLRLRPDAVVSFSGTPLGLEQDLVPRAGYRLDLVPMPPLARWSETPLAAFPFLAARSIRLALRQLQTEDVDVVVGMGGYPSVPVVVAARILRIPVLLHESNAVPGRANALAARLTRNIATGFAPGRARWCRGKDVRHVGFPISPAIAALDVPAARGEARAHFEVDTGRRFYVVSGGSQGAARLDTAAVRLAGMWRDRTDVQMLIKARADDADELGAELRASGGHRIASLVPHIDRMDLAYAAADAMVLRSGSATIAELEHVGTPAVLVPYPHAPGDHQTHNAAALAATRQARVVRDEELTAASLAEALSLLEVEGRAPEAAAIVPRDIHATAAESVARWAMDLARTSPRISHRKDR